MESTNQQATQMDKSYTLAEWLKVWLEIYKMPCVSAATFNRNSSTVKLICSCKSANKNITQITEQETQSILNELKNRNLGNGKTYSASSLKKVKSVLTQALKKAKKEKLLLFNPAGELIMPKASTKKILPLTHSEEERLELCCQSDSMGDIVRFLLLTGLRISELMNLQLSDYDPEDKKIYITKSKTEAGIRIVYLVSEAQKILENNLRKSNGKDNFIFHNIHGKPLTFNSIYKMIARLRKSAKIANLTPHVCRHTFVTRLCEKGVPAKAIAQIIGHAGTGYVLDIYAQLEQKELRKAIYALEDDSAEQEIRISFTEQLYSQLHQEAAQAGQSVNEYIFAAIKEKISR